MLEAWQFDQERRGSVAPGGALVASKMVAVAFWGSSATILRSVSKEQEGLCLEPPTSPEASEPQLGCPLPVSLGPWPTGCAPSLSFFVQSRLLAHPPPGQGLKEASPFCFGSLPQSGSVPQLDLKDIWGEGYPGMPRLIAWALKLTFYRQFCTFVEKCVTCPQPNSLFSPVL